MKQATDQDIEQALALWNPHVNAVVEELRALRGALAKIASIEADRGAPPIMAGELREIAREALKCS